MNKKDKLTDWFSELPTEQPSTDFTRKVMDQIMTEWRLNPVKYQPIISKKGWWTIGGMALLLTTILFMIHSTVLEPTETTSQQSLFGFDLSNLITPISYYFSKLSDISPAVVIGLLAIFALWFFDQLFIRAVRR